MFKKKIRIAVIGNCQARPIAQLLLLLNPNIEITTIAIVHLLKSEEKDEYWSLFDQADLIITQLIADNYPCSFVRTNFLKTHYKYKMISIVNLYYLGYSPDLMYIRDTAQGTLKSPLREYHNKTILEAFQSGLTIQEAIQNYHSYDYNKVRYKGVAEESLAELKKRELQTDIRIVDFIEEKISLERLFFVFNHPSISLIYEYVKRILRASDIPIVNDIDPRKTKDSLDSIIVPINIYSAWDIDIKFKSSAQFKGIDCVIRNKKILLTNHEKIYTIEEIADVFYRIYDLFLVKETV